MLECQDWSPTMFPFANCGHCILWHAIFVKCPKKRGLPWQPKWHLTGSKTSILNTKCKPTMFGGLSNIWLQKDIFCYNFRKPFAPELWPLLWLMSKSKIGLCCIISSGCGRSQCAFGCLNSKEESHDSFLFCNKLVGRLEHLTWKL
jgi:hypothetical protein